jgi:AcrR family transcriptional regulator
MVYRRTSEACRREERTRRSVLEAARSVVAEDGLAGTSVAAVAGRAGVGIGTVYRCFPSKSDLICEVVRDICSHELTVLRAVLDPADAPGPGPDDACARLSDLVTVFAGRAIRSGRTAYAMIVEPAAAQVELTRLEIRAELADVFATVIEQGIERGDFPRQNAFVGGVALVGAISEVLVGPISPVTADMTDADTAALLDDIVEFANRAINGAIHRATEVPA